jgi:hypothetical protein
MLTLSGVVVEGFVHVAGDIGRLRLLHATLVPGRRLDEDTGAPASANPSLLVDGAGGGNTINAQARIQIAYSITGPLVVPEHADGIWLLDSIADGLGATAIDGGGGAPGAPLVVERSTIFNATHVRSVHASESIFTGALTAERTQDGCVRFSYVAPNSRTPRRYRCQPDLTIAAAIDEALKANPALTQPERDAIRAHIQRWLVPSFTATRYGLPSYAQLHLACPVEIRTGAEDGAEMGAFSHLKQPQRESNLRVRLQEYLPFGLEPGVLYVT